MKTIYERANELSEASKGFETIVNGACYRDGFKGKNCMPMAKDCAAAIRKILRVYFPECKFSIESADYMSCGRIDVRLMSSPYPIDWSIMSTYEEESRHFQGCQWFATRGDLVNWHGSENKINNPLPKELRAVFKATIDCVNSFRYCDDTPEVDYYDSNFYAFYAVGKWDRGYEVTEKKKAA